MDTQFYKDLLESISDGVYFVDLNRTIIYWNPAAERISGYTAKEVVGRSCANNILQHVDGIGTELCLSGCPLSATMQDGKVREAEVFLHHKLGHRVPVSIRGTPMRDEEGNIVGAVEVFSDNSKHVDIVSELETLRSEVLTDPLTGIGNRRYAEITMVNLDKAMEDNDITFGVIFADIDHFKDVNDNWGHSVGDKVLKMIAGTMTSILRKLDVACRWGGEEFIVFIPNIEAKELARTSERLRLLVENSWLEYEGENIQVTMSFGCAVSCKGESAQSVVNRADEQLYKSKQNGRNCSFIDC